MSQKAGKIAHLLRSVQGRALDAPYLAYFECFNRQQFFEAHEVLESLWLPQRHGPDGAFYKGLIQLAGAFVHIQKGRPGPAAALFRLAQSNLAKYPPSHRHCDLVRVLALAHSWQRKIESASVANPPRLEPAPEIHLQGDFWPNSGNPPPGTP